MPGGGRSRGGTAEMGERKGEAGERGPRMGQWSGKAGMGAVRGLKKVSGEREGGIKWWVWDLGRMRDRIMGKEVKLILGHAAPAT